MQTYMYSTFVVMMHCGTVIYVALIFDKNV